MAEYLSKTQITDVTTAVKDKLDKVKQWATSAKTAAGTAIDKIGTFTAPTITINKPDMGNLTAPNPPQIGSIPDDDVTVSPTSVTYTKIGGDLTAPTLTGLSSPAYGKSVAPDTLPSSTFPAAPQTSYAPNLVLPGSSDLTKPVAPDVSEIPKPPLHPISVPEILFPTIPPFQGEVPKFTPFTGDITVTNVDLTPYVDNASNVLAASSTSFPINELVTEMINRNDRELQALTEKSFTTYAAKNFSVAPGMLVEEVDAIQESIARKNREGISEINKSYMNEQFEQWKVAVGIGIAVEKQMITIALEETRRNLETEKLRVGAAIELFNSAVAAFNSEQMARTAYASAYRAELEANLRITETYQPLVDGAMTTLTNNEVKSQMFTADTKLNQAKADVYKVQVEAASTDIKLYEQKIAAIKAQSEVVASNIEMYRQAVKSYAEGVVASSAGLNGYAAQIQAAGTQASVAEANANAYAEYARAVTKQTSVGRAYVSEQADVIKARVSAFQAASQADEAYMRAKAARLSGLAEIASTKVAAQSAKVQVYSAYNKALARYNEATSSYALLSAEHSAQSAALNALATAEVDKVNAGAKAAVASAKSALAQGAMSAMYVSASATASGSTNSSAGTSKGVSVSWGGSSNRSETIRDVASA